MFEGMGYDTQEAYDGQDALEKFQRDRFDLIISDLSMPRMDGISLLCSVKSEKPEIHFIMITGYTSGYLFHKAKTLGADGILRKPFTFDEMTRLITSIDIFSTRRKSFPAIP